MERSGVVYGRKVVLELLRSGNQADRIIYVKGSHEGSIKAIIRLAKELKIPVSEAVRQKLDDMCRDEDGNTANHQGVLAVVPERAYNSLEEIIEKSKTADHSLVVLLDGITDPHNIGAILRTAECSGASGMVLTKHRSGSLNATVVKVSSGAAEHLPVAKVPNLTAAIGALKQAGFWVIGADMGGGELYGVDLKGHIALVIGAEGSGLSRLVKENCDILASIPMLGRIEALNASVAAGVLMYEKLRQERFHDAGSK